MFRKITTPTFVQVGSAWQLFLDSQRCLGAKVISKEAARNLVTLGLMEGVITEQEFRVVSDDLETSTNMLETQLVRSCHHCRQDHQFPLNNGRWSEKFLDIQSGMDLARKAMRSAQLLPNHVGKIREELHSLGVPANPEIVRQNEAFSVWVIAIVF